MNLMCEYIYKRKAAIRVSKGNFENYLNNLPRCEVIVA